MKGIQKQRQTVRKRFSTSIWSETTKNAHPKLVQWRLVSSGQTKHEARHMGTGDSVTSKCSLPLALDQLQPV